MCNISNIHQLTHYPRYPVPQANKNSQWSRRRSSNGFEPGVGALVCWTGECGGPGSRTFKTYHQTPSCFFISDPLKPLKTPGVGALVCWTGECGGDKDWPVCPDADADMRLVMGLATIHRLFPYHLDFMSANLIRNHIYPSCAS